MSVYIFIFCFFCFFFFKQKTAYEISACLVGSEMCIRDRYVGMPSKPDKSSKTGYRDTAKPITGEFRKQLHGAILTAYSAEIGRLQAVAAAQERPSIKDQLEAGAKEAASEKAARPPKEKPAKGAER